MQRVCKKYISSTLVSFFLSKSAKSMQKAVFVYSHAARAAQADYRHITYFFFMGVFFCLFLYINN